jgi:hypothetical protein
MAKETTALCVPVPSPHSGLLPHRVQMRLRLAHQDVAGLRLSTSRVLCLTSHCLICLAAADLNPPPVLASGSTNEEEKA